MKQTEIQILSVDDDPDISYLIRRILEQEGYQVASFQDGAQALEALEAESIYPSLALLDIDMPSVDGYTLCEKLQAKPAWSLIPVVFLTATPSEMNRLKAFRLGAVGFLSKPVDPDSLPQQIAKYLRVGQNWQQSFEEPAKPALTPSENSSRTEVVSPAKSSQLPVVRQGFLGFLQYISAQTGREIHSPPPLERLYDLERETQLTHAQLAKLLAAYTKLEYLENLHSDRVKLGVLPVPFCRKYEVVPVQDQDQTAFVLSNPFHIELEDALQRFGKSRRYIAEPAKIQALFSGQSIRPDMIELNLNELMDEVQTKYQPPEAETIPLDVGDEDAAPLIRLVNRLIEQAYQMRASDIHIEPGENHVIVRYRIDGDLRVISRLEPPSLIQPMVARLKIMSGLNISERRLPQDGRIIFKEHGNRQLDLDLRVATAPMQYGEKVVMRLIDKQKITLPLDQLGFSARNLAIYREQARSPYGMILHTGPTGSGKSMTLYAALNEIKRPEINIQTAEDPIEYSLPEINQLQVKPEIGLTFARALRSYLRQDPDVILVGEIRDRETAHIAVEAALTGHLLLSTLHTNDAAGTLTRFVEMGVEPFMVSASVVMICAQRLLRRLCSECRQPVLASPEQKQLLGCPEHRELMLYKATGCPSCEHIGYRDRLGVHELLVPTEALRKALNQPGMTAETLKQQAVSEGMTTLFWDGMEKVLQGLTSLEELYTRVRPDDFESRPVWWNWGS